MNEVKSPYKKFNLFNKQQKGIDDEGRIVSLQTNTCLHFEHIVIQNMKISTEAIFLLGKISKIPDSASDKTSIQLGKVYLFKYFNNQLLEQFSLFDEDVYSFEIINSLKNSYIISFGKDLLKEGECITKFKVFDISECVDPSHIGKIPKEIYTQIMERKEKENKKIVFEHKKEENIIIDNVNNVSVSENGFCVAIGTNEEIVFMINKDKAIWKCNLNEIGVVLFKIKDNAKITNIVISNDDIVSGNINKMVNFYYTSSSGIYYGNVNINSSSVNVDKIKDVSVTQRNCLVMKANTNDEIYVAYSTNVLLIKNSVIIKEFTFEGNISYLHLFNEYICMCINKSKLYYLGIFDMKAYLFQQYDKIDDEITTMLSDNESFWYLTKDKKTSLQVIIELKEKQKNEKFDLFYSNGCYDAAIQYAISLHYSPKQIFNIRLLYAEYLYKKEDYANSIKQYIQTIGFLDPSIVIRKFYEGDKINFLIEYLESIRLNKQFISTLRGNDYKNYTALLISCYIKLKNISKLEEIVQLTGTEEQQLIIETAIEICKEQQEIKTAELIAQKTNKIEYIIQILLEFKNEFNDALTKIEEETKCQQIQLFLKFGPKLIDKAKDRTIQMAYNLIRDIVDSIETNDEIDKDPNNSMILQMLIKYGSITCKNKKDNIYESKNENCLVLQTPIEGMKVDIMKGREILITKKYMELYKVLNKLNEQGEIALEKEIVRHPSLFPALNSSPQIIQLIKEYPKCIFELIGYDGKEEELVQLIKENNSLIKLFAYYKGIGSLVMQKPKIIPILSNHWEIFKIIQTHPNIADIIIQYPALAGLMCKYPELGRIINFYPEISQIVITYPRIAKLIKDNTKLVKYLIKEPQLIELIKHYPSFHILNEEPSISDILSNKKYLNDMKCAVKLEYAKKLREEYEIKAYRAESVLSIIVNQERSVEIRKMINIIINEYSQVNKSIKYKYIEQLLDRYNELLRAGKDKSKEYDDSTMESISKTLLQLIDSKNPFSKNIDISYVMVLFQINHFKEGIIKLINQSELSNELFSLYIELSAIEQNKNEHYDKIVDLCVKKENEKEIKIKELKENGNVDEIYNIQPSSRNNWMQTLGFFINNSSELFNTKNGMINFKKVILALAEKYHISPVYLIHLFKKDRTKNKFPKEEQSNNIKIPYKAVKEYFLNYVKSRNTAYQQELMEYNNNVKQFNIKETELNTFKEKSLETTLNNCHICQKPLLIPYIYFLCGHGFHKSCYQNETTDKELKKENLSCHICKQSNQKLLTKLETFQKEDTIYLKELKQDLNNPLCEDKADIVASYLGKGVFDQKSWKDIINHYS